MRKSLFVLALPLVAIAFFSLHLSNSIQQATANRIENEKLEAFDLIGENAGLSQTRTKVWRTDDGGNSWREITPPKSSDEQIVSAVSFNDVKRGAAILADLKKTALELARTNDGGVSWTKQTLNLPAETIGEANLNRIPLEFVDERNGFLILRLQSSSNFTRAAIFATGDAGATWRAEQNFMQPGERPLETLFAAALTDRRRAIAEINGKEFEFLSQTVDRVSFAAPLAADEAVTAIDFRSAQTGWILTEAGRCLGFKSDCEQQARLLATDDGGKSWRDATPETARKAVKISDTERSASVAAPVGSNRISMNRGFDKCTAAPASQMQTWWDNSPFADSNIYISGRNRGCSQPQLTAAWVDQVSTMGWGLIPTIVGYQAPCSVCTTCQKHSSDAATAETQGRGEADIAANDAANLGLMPGTVLYYDMERYDETSSTPGCRTSVNAFLKGWTDRAKERGYVSGVYGSPTNAVADWINIPAASRMDAIWMARWDNVQSTWFYASPSPQIPSHFWANHQRIKQFQAPHNETWGGVTFNIDGNTADGPVAGVRAARRPPADFDGDGKTDVSVFRPDGGSWFVQNSANNSFGAVNFGVATDTIVPGDYDGDRRTDYAVFRDGVWYGYFYNPSRPNAANVRIRQWGASGDVPVPADYDGDGITDLAVFRNGAWYITNSFDPRDPSFRAEQFGQAGDIPLAGGDYDGDGRADLAVYRSGVLYIMRSMQGFTAVQFGNATDKPVPSDYDGDGKTDIAVYRSGIWYILNSQDGSFRAFGFGQTGDKPVPGDYDGDGKADIAVYRPENGFWYAQRSQAGFLAVNFGNATDRPVPAAYIPQN